MHEFIVKILLVSTLGVFLGAETSAQDTPSQFQQPQQPQQLQQIQARGCLRVGTTGDYKPFSYRTTPKSPYIGFDIDMARSLAQQLGVKLELVPTSWPNLMRDLAAGRFDLAMSGVSISAEREKLAMFSSPYLRDGKTPIALCHQQQTFQNLAQIDQASVRVIVNPGGTNESFARAHLKHAQISVYADNNGIFDQILAGKADVMITDAIEARLQQQLKPSLCAIHPESPFNVSFKAYLLPRDAEWKAYVDRWLQGQQGQIQLRMDQWLQHPWPSASAEGIDLAPLRDLIQRRLAMMESVAQHKWNQQSAIEDLPREQKIIASLQQQANALGISADWAEHFFRAQIEAAKQRQSEYFALWRTQGVGKFDHVPDLDQQIRPQLDQLTTQILRQLAMAWPAITDLQQQKRITTSMQSLLEDQSSGLATKMAIQPLIDGSAQQ